MKGAINATELRASLLGVLRRVRKGERITVIYRRRPAFQIVPVESVRASDRTLETDPLFRAAALGRSCESPSATEHDALLYRP
jgi:prevent-host-death family protein